MFKTLSVLMSLMACCWLLSSGPARGEDEDPSVLFEPREYAATDGAILRYRLMKPKQTQADQKFPLVIFLHGAGERGSDNVAQLKHGMKELCTAERREKMPCYVLAPQCPRDEKWADVNWLKAGVEKPDIISRSLELTLELVDEMLQQSSIDDSRIYITGLSMGGFGTWDALTRRPDFFAAAMPICGGGDPATAKQIKHIPIACFHGADDKVVTPDKSRAIIQALNESGAEPRYVEYPGVGHDSWSQTYANDDNWKWLFEQRKRGL